MKVGSYRYKRVFISSTFATEMNPSLGFHCPMGCRWLGTKPRTIEGEGFMKRPLHKSTSPQGYTLRVRWTRNKYPSSPQGSTRQITCLDPQHRMDRPIEPPPRIHDILRWSKGTLRSVQFSSVLSHVRRFATPWTAACQASLSITNSWSLLKLMSIELEMPSNHFTFCHHLLLLPSIFPSIRVFSDEAVLPIRWPKYWSFSFSISPSNGYLWLISFRMDWLDLLVVQGSLKSLFQHHSSKTSILRHSAFFIVQLSHPYMTTGKTID